MPMEVIHLLINVDMKNNVAGPTGRQGILPKRGSLCLRNRCLGTTGGETRLQRFRVLSRAKNAFGVRIPALWKHTTGDAAKAALRVVKSKSCNSLRSKRIMELKCRGFHTIHMVHMLLLSASSASSPAPCRAASNSFLPASSSSRLRCLRSM